MLILLKGVKLLVREDMRSFLIRMTEERKMMDRKRLLGAFFAVAVGLSPTMATADSSSPYWSRKQQVEDASRPQPSQMTMQEKQFALRLSDLHRQIFVYQFTPAQRQEAMAFMTTNANRGWRSSKVTPDMAVEDVIKNHRGIHTGQGQSDEMMNEPETNYYAPKKSQRQNPYGQRNTREYQRSMPQNEQHYQGQPNEQEEPRMRGGQRENWKRKPRYSQQPQEMEEHQMRKEQEQMYYKNPKSPYHRSQQQKQRMQQKNRNFSNYGSLQEKTPPQQKEKKMSRSNKNRSQGYWYNTDGSASNARKSSKKQQKRAQAQRGYWD